MHHDLVHRTGEARSDLSGEVAFAEVLLVCLVDREDDLGDRVRAHDIVDCLQRVLVSDPGGLFGVDARPARFAVILRAGNS